MVTMEYPWYQMTNRDGGKVKCQLIYSPIKTKYDGTPYGLERGCIQIPLNEGGYDFRAVPMKFLEKI